MAQLRWPQTPRTPPVVEHVRAPQPIRFPEEEEVPEGSAHLAVRTFLYQLVTFTLGPEHSVGSDQFVFWIASNTQVRLSPDVFVKLGVRQTMFGSWKTWEQGGVPELAVEIVSPNEGDGLMWEEKLSRYHELGIKELVRFDPEELVGRRLRVWDRVDGDLVQRVVADDRTPCLTLGLTWTVQMLSTPAGAVLGLRLVDDDGRLLQTREEKESARADEEARARVAAEARIKELEEELRRRGG